ncbi:MULTISPECIES: hypothetical protein [unclassified Streptomyces]|uniref:hypothetical protein n=1 Tax=unclassified Streptomyces TaxID=2593676 RepID=UPI002E2D914A|nr:MULTISPECIES: hypothetical protein [unclassified Streptomyces]
MRKTVTGAALLVAAALLTGCGSDSGNGDGKAKASPSADSAKPSAAQSPSASAGAAGGVKGGATHEVTLEVEGQGRTQVMYHADSTGFEEQTLPWKKTETIELTGAEQKVGYLVNVLPGSVKAADGSLKQAPCTITVDGKKVADNEGGKNPKGCSFLVK